MTSEFDADACLSWLDDQQGPIPKQRMLDEWPSFPYENLFGVTCPVIEGEVAYYTRDLRRAAVDRQPID
jgi:hypothetical protein